MLTTISVHDFFSRLAGEDAPGSGSGAALLGLTGVSILEMAARFCGRADEKTAQLPALWAELVRLHADLERLIERDAAVLARALPALTAVGPDGDSREWNEVLTEAVAVPFAIAQACIDAMEIAKHLLDLTALNTACDLKFAAMSCHTGLQGAVLLAELNISLLRDDAKLAHRLQTEAETILDRGERMLERVLN